MSCRVASRPPPTHKQESGAKASRGGSAEGHRVKDQDRVYEKDIDWCRMYRFSAAKLTLDVHFMMSLHLVQGTHRSKAIFEGTRAIQRAVSEPATFRGICPSPCDAAGCPSLRRFLFADTFILHQVFSNIVVLFCCATRPSLVQSTKRNRKRATAGAVIFSGDEARAHTCMHRRRHPCVHDVTQLS